MPDDNLIVDYLPALSKLFLAGSFSATCSTAVLQPFDLIKTQMQNAPHGQRYRMFNTAKSVVATHGIVGLWTGLTPTLIKTVPGIGIYLASLVQLKSLFFGRDSDPRLTENLLIGVVARSIPAVILIPITVVKTRYESGMYKYRSVLHALSSIYSHEGIRGLTCGLWPTILRDAPFSGIYYMVLMELKYFSLPGFNHVGNTFISGIIAGSVASVIVHPADVVKTKMQLHPETYSTLRKSIKEIIVTRGLGAFYLGLVPRLIRRTLFAALTWTVFESLLTRLGLK